MTLSLIVAASSNNAIGKKNELLWKLPNDTRFFKNTTWAMPVIMGRATYASLGYKPLNGRFNFVITRQNNWDPQSRSVQVLSGLNEAIEAAGKTDCREIFITGGGDVYAQAMPLADIIYMTRVHAVLDGDAFFPPIDEKQWRLLNERNTEPDEKHEYACSFQVWKRIR